ncbi:MAG: NlpC/P60 family protein [Bacteroidales bacterium]
MENGICLQSVIPVRCEPSHKSEMVTQILFGELYKVTEKTSSWLKIKLLYDGYEGWISAIQASLLDDEEYLRLSESPKQITLDLVQLLTNDTPPSFIPIVLGSSLPAMNDSMISVGQHRFHFEGTLSDSTINETKADIIKHRDVALQLLEDAKIYLNSPYLWGGRTPFGIDCSGFTQMAYKLQGFKLLRDASQQATQGEVVGLLAEAKPADLAFFDDAEGNINHVGILINRQYIMHCSGSVRIDSLDHEGIYNESEQKYTHKLRLIKRIL